MMLVHSPLSQKQVTQKVSLKDGKVPKDIEMFIYLYTHHKTYEQCSQATDTIFCPVLSITDCNFLFEFRFLYFLNSR